MRNRRGLKRWLRHAGISFGIGLSLYGQALSSSPATPTASSGVPVLIYHEIGNDQKPPGETVIPLARFSEQMRYLARQGYHTISVDDLVRHMRWGTALPPRPVVLTFDDGWKNVLQAVPILKQHKFKASFWIITGKGIGGDYMDWNDIQALSNYPDFEVLSHTVSHPWHPVDNLYNWVEGRVPGKGDQDALAELTDARLELTHRLHRAQPYLAWPCGWYNERLIELAQKAGYKALFSAEAGLNHHGDDVLRIKRTFVDGACPLSVFARSLKDGQYRACQPGGHTTRGHRPPL